MAKLIEFGYVIILKAMKALGYLYPGNEMKYEAEVCYEEVACGANFSYGIEIGSDFEGRSKLMASSF